MTGRKEIMSNYVKEYGGPVRFGNNDVAPIFDHRDLVCDNITIEDVSYVEGLGHNLFSIGKICDKDLQVNFNKTKCTVPTEEGK